MKSAQPLPPESEATPKKAYETPELKVYGKPEITVLGSVEHLTQFSF